MNAVKVYKEIEDNKIETLVDRVEGSSRTAGLCDECIIALMGSLEFMLDSGLITMDQHSELYLGMCNRVHCIEFN